MSSLLFSAVFATNANATDYGRQVVRFLTIQHTSSAAEGFTADPRRGDFVARLNRGEIAEWRVRLYAGRTYRFVGACDEDCSDVDISVHNRYGVIVGADFAPDDHPTVTLTPVTDEIVTVRVSMAACRSEPCYAGARVLRR
jgi:hypothetical protein